MLSDCWAAEVVAGAEEEGDCLSRSPSVGEGAVSLSCDIVVVMGWVLMAITVVGL